MREKYTHFNNELSRFIAPVEVDAGTFMNNKALDVNLAATYYDKKHCFNVKTSVQNKTAAAAFIT